MQPGVQFKQCPRCGQMIAQDALMCPACGQAFGNPYSPQPQHQAFSPVVGPVELQQAANKKIIAGICGILLGSLGIHKFVLGYTTSGLIMLLGSLVTCGAAGAVFGLIGLIEGIIYLTKRDDEFYIHYIAGKHEWF